MSESIIYTIPVISLLKAGAANQLEFFPQTCFSRMSRLLLPQTLKAHYIRFAAKAFVTPGQEERVSGRNSNWQPVLA